MKKFIKEKLLTKKGSLDSNKLKEEWYIKNGYTFEYEIIYSYVGHTMAQKIYNIFNDIKNIPLCEHCNKNEVFFKNYSEGYRKYCSVKCSSNSAEKKNLIEKTNIKKYGTKTVSQNIFVKEKIKQTNLKKYGVDYSIKSDIIKEKIKQTNLKKYGVENTQQKDVSKESLMKLNDVNWLINQHHEQEKSLSELSIELNVTKKTVANYFRKHDLEIKRFSVSLPEKELVEFLSKYTLVETNKRDIITPLELDIYLPEYKLAIEFNGLYWHSETFKNKKYHINKTIKCNGLGIKLIHIFEDEWYNKQQIIKSILLNKLGKYDKKIFARNCDFKKCNNKEVKIFVNENHIQGNTKAKDYYCLYYLDELVCVASVDESRFNKNDFELIRFCSKLNYIIVGGFSKLLKEIKKEYDEIYSYTDLRYFNGGIYKKYGVFVKRTDCGYFWTDGVVRIPRYRTQKNRLKNFLGSKYDEKLTENENMINAGYDKIYDCGNDLYLL